MAVGVMASRPMARTGACSGCGVIPCICRVDHSTRVEPCVCGGRVVVVDRSNHLAVITAVSLHNASTGHRQAMRALGWD